MTKSSTDLKTSHIANELFRVSDRVLDAELLVVIGAVAHHIHLADEGPLPLVVHHVRQDLGPLQVDRGVVGGCRGSVPKQALLPRVRRRSIKRAIN